MVTLAVVFLRRFGFGGVLTGARRPTVARHWVARPSTERGLLMGIWDEPELQNQKGLVWLGIRP